MSKNVEECREMSRNVVARPGGGPFQCFQKWFVDKVWLIVSLSKTEKKAGNKEQKEEKQKKKKTKEKKRKTENTKKKTEKMSSDSSDGLELASRQKLVFGGFWDGFS